MLLLFFILIQYTSYQYLIGRYTDFSKSATIHKIAPYEYFILFCSTFFLKSNQVKANIVSFYLIELNYLSEIHLDVFNYHHYLCMGCIIFSCLFKSTQKQDIFRINCFKIASFTIFLTGNLYKINKKLNSFIEKIFLLPFLLLSSKKALYLKDYFSIIFAIAIGHLYLPQKWKLYNIIHPFVVPATALAKPSLAKS